MSIRGTAPDLHGQGEFDLLIMGGDVVDGLGTARHKADVGVRGDTISEVGPLDSAHAPLRIDASGQVVSPGFVDLHTHSDLTVLVNPEMQSSALQGVTTELMGNCGLSVGLSVSGHGFSLERRYAGAIPGFAWNGMGEFLDAIQQNGCAINVLSLAGHNTVRKRSMGGDQRPPTLSELTDMKAILREAMNEGAVGLSTGLEYPPGRYAETDEIVALARVVAESGGIYTSHIRNESDHLLESVREALSIGEQAGLPVQLSHHKAEGPSNWGKVHESLKMVDEALQRGCDVTLDQYPYTAFMTGLAIPVFPAWALSGADAELQHRLADPAIRSQLLEHLRSLSMDWSLVRISVARTHREFQGRTIADLSHDWGLAPEEGLLRVLEDERGFVAATYVMMSEEDVQFVMRYPRTFIASDAASSNNHGVLSHDRPHPRTFGTFPRVLGRYVRELGVLPLEVAIAKMTHMPTRRLGLTDRGSIEVGKRADLVVFDPKTIIDQANDDDPRGAPAGISAVLVNGQIIVRNGELTGHRPGRALRRPV